MSIWDLLKNEFDYEIKAMGVEPAYFPLFIPQSFLSKEADHVDGFAKVPYIPYIPDISYISYIPYTPTTQHSAMFT